MHANLLAAAALAADFHIRAVGSPSAVDGNRAERAIHELTHTQLVHTVGDCISIL